MDIRVDVEQSLYQMSVPSVLICIAVIVYVLYLAERFRSK